VTSHPIISPPRRAQLLSSQPRPFAPPNLLCRGSRHRHLIRQRKRKGKYDRPRYSHSQRLQAFSRFYAQALKPLGITTLPDYEGKDGHPDLKGFGIGKSHFFWLKEGKPDPQAVHVGFVAKDHSEVDAFYKAALAAGGKSKKPPQARPEYYPGYYATWVLDPDGHDIEVVNKS